MAGFYWTKEAEKYFNDLSKSSSFGRIGARGKQTVGNKFDVYFLCLNVGLSEAKILDGEITEEVTRYPPRPYTKPNVQSQLFAALVSSELERKGVRFRGNREQIKNIMIKMIDLRDNYDLSEDGYTLLNKYANKGFQLISKKITKPKDLDTFYSNIHKHFIKE